MSYSTPASDALLESLDVPYTFERRPEPLAAALRPTWRVPLLLLLVEKGHGGGTSWKALHVLSWALRHPRHREMLLELRQGFDRPDRALVRIEPALDRAIDLAVALGYLDAARQRRSFRLTRAGREALNAIKASDVFTEERSYLSALRGKVTQSEVEQLLEWRAR